MIVSLYKSYEITDKVTEDYHVKIFEFFKNFLLIYIPSARKNKKTLLDSIMLILTAFLCKDGLVTSDSSVINDYIGTKFDFLYSLVNIIRNISKDSKEDFQVEYISFKIIKFLSFLVLYFNSEKDIDTDVDMADSKEESKNHYIRTKSNNINKKYKMLILQRKVMAAQIKKILDKFKIDTLAFSIKNKNEKEDDFKKLLVVTNEVDKSIKWSNFSDEINDFYQKLQQDNYILINKDNNEVDLKTILAEKEEYYLKSEAKYFKKIEEFYSFLNWIKTEKINTVMEESFDDSKMNISNISMSVGRNEDMKGNYFQIYFKI